MRICRWPHPLGVRANISRPSARCPAGSRRRMRQKMVIRAFRQSGRPEQVPEPMSQPRQHGDDHRSVPVADLHASRASTFSRYATLALRYAFSSSRSCSLVGAGLGLDFAPLGLPFGFGRSASGPPDRYSRHQRSNGAGPADPCTSPYFGLRQPMLHMVRRTAAELRLASRISCCLRVLP